jgi:hypothetical protein
MSAYLVSILVVEFQNQGKRVRVARFEIVGNIAGVHEDDVHVMEPFTIQHSQKMAMVHIADRKTVNRLHVKSEARVLSCSAVNVASTKIFAVTEQV